MADTDDHVVRRVEDGVAWITLNRPEAGNAITASMRDQVVAWLEDASADLAVRAVVLTGAGEKGFCTGADLRAQGPARDRPEGAPSPAVGDNARTIRNGWQRLIGAVLDCEKPVVASVNATAAGGGMHLALACDLVLAAEEAKFIEVFVRRGIAPDAGGAYLLARLVGPQKAKELFFFGDDVPAREAERIGLVNRVVPRSGAGRGDRPLGGPAGRRPHQGHRSGQVPDQPGPGDRPGPVLLGRGGGPGAGDHHRGLPGGPGRLRRASPARLPGLVSVAAWSTVTGRAATGDHRGPGGRISG